MTSLYIELAHRFRGEAEDLDKTVERALRVWYQVNSAAVDQDVYLDSVALNLHSFYSGLEKLFQLIADHLDNNLPSGKNWHQELLQAMGREGDIRPALIDSDQINTLDEFRRFRHVVRNVYATHLLPERMSTLLDALPQLWDNLQVELLAFADFLEQLANDET